VLSEESEQGRQGWPEARGAEGFTLRARAGDKAIHVAMLCLCVPPSLG